ncbi:MAG: protein O-mannosyl-transferase family, partial [Gemmatimonadales bacterium]
HEVTSKLFTVRWTQLVAAAVCALVGATSFTVWNQSVVNEKVYTVSLLQLTVVVWLAIRWTRRPAGTAADRLLVVIAYLLALGYTIHPAGYLAAPCIVAVVLLVAPKTFVRGRLVAQALAATVFGLSLFAFEPIRSANNPALNEGEPTACVTGFAVGCTLSTVTLERLNAQVSRDQYSKPALSNRQASFGAQLGMWWQYFTWQWFRDPHGAHPVAQLELALLAILLALTGARTHARADRPGFVLMAALVATLTVALIFYLNFKYGYSQAPELGTLVPREVRDRDYFFLWSFSCLGVWTGLGIAQCWRALAAGIRRPRALAIAMPVLAISLLPLALNAHAASRAGQTFTRDFARDLLDSVAPNGILITNGDNDTFPLWYAQEVEGHRRDVVVIVASYLGTDWFPWQLMRRGIAVAGSPEEADGVPRSVQLAAPQQFEAGAIRATIPAGYLSRDQLFVLRIVRDVLPRRPVYFSNAIYPRALGLAPYLVIEGLAVHLMPAAVTESAAVVRTNAGMVDAVRSLALWRATFRGPAAFEAQGEWVDAASLVMPAQYVIAGSVLFEALGNRGRTAEAAAVSSDVQRLLAIASLGSVFGRND